MHAIHAIVVVALSIVAIHPKLQENVLMKK
jgi:hypothetical protein